MSNENLSLQEKVQKHAEDLRSRMSIGESKQIRDLRYKDEYLNLLREQGFEVDRFDFGIQMLEVKRIR